MFWARKLNSYLPSKKTDFDISLFHMYDGEPSISIKEAKKGIIIKSKHSYDALEEFTIFFPAVNAFFKEKNAGNLGVILLNTVVKNIPNTRHYSIV